MSYPDERGPHNVGPQNAGSPNAGPGESGPGQTPTRPALVAPMAIATELWLVVIVAQAVAYGGQYPTAADTIRDAARDRGAADEVALMTSTGFIVTLVVISGVILAAVSLTLTWLARSGHGWARLVLAFFSAYLVVQAVFALFDGMGPLWTTVPEVISGVAAVGAVALLLRRESDAYCKEMSRYRRLRRGRGAGWTPYPNPPGSERLPSHPTVSGHPPWPSPHQPPAPPGAQPPDGSGYYDPHAHRPPGYGPYPPPAPAPPPAHPQPTPGDGPSNDLPRDDLPRNDLPRNDRWRDESGRPASGANVRERDLRAETASEKAPGALAEESPAQRHTDADDTAVHDTARDDTARDDTARDDTHESR